MGIFDGLKEVKAVAGGNYIKPGTYFARIDKAEQINTRKGEACVLNMTILYVLDDDNGNGHKSGQEVSDLHLANKEGFLSRIKKIVGRLMSVPDDEIDDTIGPDEATFAFGSTNPLGGSCFLVEARTIKTKSGHDCTNTDYKRRVALEEVDDKLSAEEKKLLFPGTMWEDCLAKEAAFQAG